MTAARTPRAPACLAAAQAAAAHELFPLKEPFLFKSRYVISNSSEIKLSEENPQAPHNPQ